MGRAYYVRASGDALFTLFQEPEQVALGFDKLPESIRFPSEEDINKVLEEDEEVKKILLDDKGHPDPMRRDLHRYAERAIAQEAYRYALCILMISDKAYKTL